MKLKKLLAALSMALTATAFAQVNLVSTQLRPVEEAEKMRNVLLKGSPDAVNFVPEDPNTYMTRMQAELAGATGKVHLTMAIDGELSPINSIGGLQGVDDILKKLSANREFSAGALTLAKLGGTEARMIPFMSNTFQMGVNKKALQYLPQGADVNALTWAQTIQWAKNMKAGTGENKFGLPAGPRGLIHRFFQGYAYPAYTGGVVRTFKSADAEKMWADLKDLWTVTNPRSTSYGFMEEPLKTGEVWVAFDHTARLLPAFNDKPDEFIAVPAPSAAKGRFFMPVIIGMGVPKNTPDRAAAERLLDHLTKPATQSQLLQVGFFPVIKTDMSAMPKGAAVAAIGVANTFNAKDGRAALLPVGLGAKTGEFNKVYVDTFQRIIVKGEDIKTVLSEQAVALDAVMKEAKAACWAPDASSGKDTCPVQ